MLVLLLLAARMNALCSRRTSCSSPHPPLSVSFFASIYTHFYFVTGRCCCSCCCCCFCCCWLLLLSHFRCCCCSYLPCLYCTSPQAFYYCSTLTSVEFAANSNLLTIGERAFYFTGLTGTIAIPASVTSIGSYVSTPPPPPPSAPCSLACAVPCLCCCCSLLV